MGFRYFSLLLGLRVALLTALLSAVVYLGLASGYPTLVALLTGLALLLVLDLLRFVKRTNTELARFLDAVRYDDFGQRFRTGELGTGFDELGRVLTDIIARFQDERAEKEEGLRHLRALVEHVPVPLLSLAADRRIVLHNNAARRLFGQVRVARLDDLAVFGKAFPGELAALGPGERRLVTFSVDGIELQLAVSATEIAIGGSLEKLISLQNIQSELDRAQLQAWQDLVRVLTHEIMNSITPVASLARTASDLVEDATGKIGDQPEVVEELADVKSAVDTVARRSDGLMQFVQGYRRLTRLPPPDTRSFALAELFASVERLIATEWEQGTLQTRFHVSPAGLELEADRDMVEQVLLNLLQNAGHALAETAAGRVEVTAAINRQGRVTLQVADNGPGVPREIAGRIFVPFFTTRREGSGVGLALTRQVMLAHGGNVTLGTSEAGGAKFTLNF